jgi:hypothetical protein
MAETYLEKAIKPYLRIFDSAVVTFFEPIAQKYGFPIVKIKNGIYEIPTPHFILRIALDFERDMGLNVTLREVSLRDFDDRALNVEYGIGCFMLFNGEDIKPLHFDINTDEGYLKMAQLLADQTERFAVPYLLGQKDDFEAVREFMKKRSAPAVERMRQMQRNIERNMPNVRQEWPVVIPREKGEEWETAKEFRATNFQFLGDLNGKREQIFKEKLIEFFKRDRSVNTAYLARIIGQELPATSALCLRTQFGFDKGMMEKIGKIFVQVFSLQENFNVIFLTEQQELLLAKLARPFFKEKIGSS